MSFIKAIITDIQTVDNLNIVHFESFGEKLSMMSLELAANLKVDTQVYLRMKPSHVAVAKEFSGEISYSNQLPCKIIKCEYGELLCSITLEFSDFTIESIITKNSAQKMDLQVGEHVTALIKASELAIEEVIHD